MYRLAAEQEVSCVKAPKKAPDGKLSGAFSWPDWRRVEGGIRFEQCGAFPVTYCDGQPLPVGDKTGTGDQRFNTYGAGGQLLESCVVNRSATFVFLIDDRFYGTITAFVPSEKAAQFGFTSGLPVQLLKQLAPTLMPRLDPVRDSSQKEPVCLG